MKRKNIVHFIVFCCLSLFTLQGEAELNLADEQIAKLEQKYDARAGKRFRAWRELIQNSKSLAEEQKLETVNIFFDSTIIFTSDSDNYGVEDYWATPYECIGRDAGDCEDYAIAKYFTLLEIGVPDEKLRLTYVKALAPWNQAHMVLSYFPSPTAAPLVLDSLIGEIKSATERNDLIPVYSFNGTGLWLAKVRGTGQQVKGGTGRLAMWEQMKNRLSRDN